MRKTVLCCLLVTLAVALLVNSCKKDSQGTSIQQLFTTDTWQLASIQASNYTGSTLISIDTLNTACLQTQFFTFKSNNTCTYTNFDCITQNTSGTWSLTGDQLYLQAKMICKDTTLAGSSRPFASAQIINLGEYSLVLQTGDIQPNYSLTKKRRIVQYGFVRQNPTSTH